jgi:hypothetical protein
MCSWVVEGLRIVALRKPLGLVAYEKDWRQLKLIDTLMSGVLGCGEPDVTTVVGPLKDLNALRVGHAHSLGVPKTRYFNIGRCGVRDAWFVVVDGVAGGLHFLAERVRANRDTSITST